MTLYQKNIIEDEEELRSLLGHPSELVSRKTISYLDVHCRDFMARSPLAMLSTSNRDGRCDVSPRGDAPGFALVLDDHHLLLPDRLGNKRLDSMVNLLSNPRIGLLFLIPGMGETLRVNGRAWITRDEELLRQTAVKNSIPAVGILVQVEECYLHCAKAVIRSSLWQPESWPSRSSLPKAGDIVSAHAGMEEMTPEKVEARLAEGYAQRLY